MGTCESFITNTMPQGQKTWSKKGPKGIKKETTNIYQPHSISLYFPSKNNQSPFFVTSLKEKKASFKNLCHSIPKRFNLNTTVPLLRILPSLYTVHRMGQRNWSSLDNSNIYVPNSTFHFFIVRSVLFQLKLSMFQLPSVTKLFF